MAETMNKPAELARVAAHASAGGTSAVEFVIWHAAASTQAPWSHPARAAVPSDGDEPDAADDAPDRELEKSLHLWRGSSCDFLYTQSSGVHCFLATRPSGDSRPRQGSVEPRPVPADVALTVDRQPYEGRTVLNPGFLYESAKSTEVLLTLSPMPSDTSLSASRFWMDVIRELAQAAAGPGNAPILFIQYPAAPIGDIGQPRHVADGVRRAHAQCVRMGVAIDRDKPRRRILFLAEAARIARENGLALQVGDRTPGAVRGQWVNAIALPDQSADLPPSLTGASPTSALAVTIMGPARRGSSLAVLSVLKRYKVGLLAISVGALQEVAFINLLIPLPPGREVPEFDPLGYQCEEGLSLITSAACLETHTEPGMGLDIVALDYRAFITGPFPVGSEPPEAKLTIPFWVAWDHVRDEEADINILFALKQAMHQLNLDGRIEYARARGRDNDHVRGRAKLAVTVVGGDGRLPLQEERLRDLARQIEDAARHHLLERQGTLDPEDLRLRVEWRERWLGAGAV